MATSMSKGRFRDALQAVLVNPPHDALDVRLLDRQVMQSVAQGDLGDQLGRVRFESIELQPATWTIRAYLPRTRHVQRTNPILRQVHDQRSLCAEPVADAVQGAVV